MVSLSCTQYRSTCLHPYSSAPQRYQIHASQGLQKTVGLTRMTDVNQTASSSLSLLDPVNARPFVPSSKAGDSRTDSSSSVNAKPFIPSTSQTSPSPSHASTSPRGKPPRLTILAKSLASVALDCGSPHKGRALRPGAQAYPFETDRACVASRPGILPQERNHGRRLIVSV